MTTLKETYTKTIVPKLKKDLNLSNVHQAPRVEKVVVNMGLGIIDKNQIQTHVGELTKITGQKPVMNRARKSVSNFKLREGMVIGAKVTLRGNRMYDFMDRFINACLPRIRDFRGLPPGSFDAQANYTLGIKDQSIFPELDPNSITATQGMDITFVTSTTDKDEAKQLLAALGMPFSDKNKNGGVPRG